MPRSIEASPRVIGAATSDRCLAGAISISMAVMKATKLPTEPPTVPLCHSAATSTADSDSAASTCVSGVITAAATTDFCDSRRSASLASTKRSACRRPAPCRRTMRQASTFSSTT